MHGPNLNNLGHRDPDIYGRFTLSDLEQHASAAAARHGWSVDCVQRNSEGDLIDALQERRREVSGAVVNPGAFMVAGWALRDALEDFSHPWIEVHISNVFAREKFRGSSVLSPLALGFVAGFRLSGYGMATDYLIEHLQGTMKETT
jgi:5-deoxy-5-amino-3-dehydroquinate dehydratase